jgi:hypothetical protein
VFHSFTLPCLLQVQVTLPPLSAAAADAGTGAGAAYTSSCSGTSIGSAVTTQANSSSSNSDGSSPACMMLVSGGLDNRVLQWDLAGGPSVLASLDVEQVGSELSAVTYLQGWSILATGGCDCY